MALITMKDMKRSLLHRGSRVVVYIDASPKPGLTYKVMTERVWVEYKRRKEVEITTLYSNTLP